jgi:hypothetical protein
MLVDLRAVVDQFFIPGVTADIGVGRGREAAWLNARGTINIIGSRNSLSNILSGSHFHSVENARKRRSM